MSDAANKIQTQGGAVFQGNVTTSGGDMRRRASAWHTHAERGHELKSQLTIYAFSGIVGATTKKRHLGVR